jgi:hypothetical protein
MKAQVKLMFACAIISCLLASGTMAATLHVDETALGANNGTSWLNAYRYLQDALAQATAGDTIKVAQGIYRPNQTTIPQPASRTDTFELKDNVRLLGGYAGLGSLIPDERRVSQYKTTLSGNQANAYTVVTSKDNTPNTELNGFTITAGNADGEENWPYEEARGGGMHINGGAPLIKYCTFQENSSIDGGGGVYAYNADPTITSCNFEKNYTKGYGAGLYNNNADSDIYGCVFNENQASRDGEGGGMFNKDCNPIIDNCDFYNNDGGFYGGAMQNYRSNPAISDCMFVGNESSTDGGAIENWTDANPIIKDCQFYYNNTASAGGAMHNYYCAPTVINCLFAGNYSASEEGGAVHNRASEARFINCVLTGNKAYEKGGAMSIADSNVAIINCTFANNIAPDGNAISVDFFSNLTAPRLVQIHNSILWDGPNAIYKANETTIVTSYSNLSSAYPGIGNIYGDPQFVDALGFDDIAGTEDDDLRLSQFSPATDAGENFAFPVSDTTKDIRGFARFQDNPNVADTGNGAFPIVDMGAHEFGTGTMPPPTPQPGPNRAPVAHAGPDQTASTSTNNMAMVQLNGSGSYDPDGNPLQYSWHWLIGNTPYEARGINPLITLPEGQHPITLIVSDGSLISIPDQVTVQVISSIPSQAWMSPETIKRGNCDGNYVFAMTQLFGITENDIDMTTPVTVYPGAVQSFYQYTNENNDGIISTTLVALIDKAELLNTISTNGTVTLTIVGKLKSGQSFSDTDQVTIVNCP